MFLFDLSSYLSLIGSFIILIIFLRNFKVRSLPFKVLGLYAAASIFFAVLQKISIHLFNNLYMNEMGNGFVLSEAALLSSLFYITIDSKRFNKGILVLAVAYVLFYIVSLIFFKTNSYSLIRSGRDLLVIICSIIYFYYLIRKLPEENLLKFPMFWINASVLFFFSGTFILSFLIDYIAQVLGDDTSGFWAFRNFFRFGFCLVLAYAGWLDLQLIRKKWLLNPD